MDAAALIIAAVTLAIVAVALVAVRRIHQTVAGLAARDWTHEADQITAVYGLTREIHSHIIPEPLPPEPKAPRKRQSSRSKSKTDGSTGGSR